MDYLVKTYMENLTGTHLSGQYRLVERIGSGGMSDVYKAWDSTRSIYMAIKILNPDLARQARTIKMFQGEADFLDELGHPNIARLYEFNVDKQYRYLVLEWIDGESLDKIIKRQTVPFSLQAVSEILSQISSALSYLHIKHVLHCDIKPGNILVNKTHKYFLADFGVARFIRGSETGGTPPYMAPEQFTDRQVSTKSDIYALGVTVYELLSGGVLPYRGKSTQSKGSTLRERIAWEHIHLPLPPIQVFNKEVSESLSKVLETALSKTPKNRYKTAYEFYNDFQKARGTDRHSYSKQNNDNGQTILEPQPKPPRIGTQREEKPGTLSSDRDKDFRSQPRLVGLHGEWRDWIILINQKQMTLGRNKEMQILFSDRSVSRYHATIIKSQQGNFIRDDGSALGTIVNGRVLNRLHKLSHQDRIQIGNHNLLEYRDR
jgi:serine/threonine protein kinase